MPNAVVAGLFLLGCFAAPLTVVVGALVLLAKPSARTTSPLTSQAATAHR